VTKKFLVTTCFGIEVMEEIRKGEAERLLVTKWLRKEVMRELGKVMRKVLVPVWLGAEVMDVFFFIVNMRIGQEVTGRKLRSR
jgi:hypothetical protein